MEAQLPCISRLPYCLPNHTDSGPRILPSETYFYLSRVQCTDMFLWFSNMGLISRSRFSLRKQMKLRRETQLSRKRSSYANRRRRRVIKNRSSTKSTCVWTESKAARSNPVFTELSFARIRRLLLGKASTITFPLRLGLCACSTTFMAT